MKSIRHILFALLSTALVFSAVVYTACNKNKCSKVMCLNNGVCYGGNCVCPVGFEGPRCEILSRDKFIFVYNGGDKCDTEAYSQYPIQLVVNPADTLEMFMRNFLNNRDDSAVCTIMAVDSFTFMGSNNSTTYFGTGKLSNDSLWLTYHVTHDTFVYDCKYFGQSLR